MPEYKLVKETGPDHRKRFEIHLFINNNLWGRGCGKNKKEAAQKAAKKALDKFLKIYPQYIPYKS